MFLRKIFSTQNRFLWVLVDLLIVIIGVYGAFALQSKAENEKNRQEQVKVLSSLKYELEHFRYRMFETNLGMMATYKKIKPLADEGRYSNYSDFRFIEPQYEYQTIRYALNLQNNEIVDFELYDVLQTLFVEVKKIEHVERLLTETARNYRSIPKNITKNSDAFHLIVSENQDNFERFVILIKDRAEIANRVSQASSEAIPLINERLGDKLSREIELKLIKQNIDMARNEEEAVYLVNKFFPSFNEKEIRKIYQKAPQKKN